MSNIPGLMARPTCMARNARWLFVGLVAVLGSICFAKMAGPPASVPLERLIKNAKGVLAEKPKDATAHFIYARLLSMRFAGLKEARPHFDQEGHVASFWVYDPLNVKRNPNTKTDERMISDLRGSLENYHFAYQNDKESGLPGLGLGWMLEEAIPLHKELKTLPWEPTKPVTEKSLLDEALRVYRAVFKKWVDKEFQDGYWISHQVCVESGERILALTKDQGETEESRQIQAQIKDLKSRPLMISPIIFPAKRTGQYYGLSNPKAKAKFDLTGEGVARTWQWVTNRAAFLAWDPQHTGKITSGRQLFGNATFYMFFDDGYKALASLDNNRDGWLMGKELDGIVIWHDRNENAVSDPGEVKQAKSAGITAIRVKASDSISGMPFARVGIKWKDGVETATFDWQPRSVAATRNP